MVTNIIFLFFIRILTFWNRNISIRYFQHSKIKFVFPSDNVMFGFLVPFFCPIVSLLFCSIFCPIFRPNFCRSLGPFFVRFFFSISCFELCPFFCLVLCPDIRYRTSHIEIGHRTSEFDRASDVGQWTLDIKHRISNVGRRTSDMGH